MSRTNSTQPLDSFELPESWLTPLGHCRFAETLLVDDHADHPRALIMIDIDDRHRVRNMLPMADLWTYDEFNRSYHRPDVLIGETPGSVAKTVVGGLITTPPSHDADPTEVGQVAAALFTRLVPMSGEVMRPARLHETKIDGTGWVTHIELVGTEPLQVYAVHTIDYGPDEPKILVAWPVD